MQTSTRLTLATGLTLAVGALLFILVGDGIQFFSGFFAGAPGSGFGASLVWTGYIIIAILIVIFVSVVSYLVYQSTHQDSSGWRGY